MTTSGQDFQVRIAEKLKELGFGQLSGDAWYDHEGEHGSFFAAEFPSGRGLYGRERRVDFRVKIRGCEFDVEAKYQEQSGTADQLAWITLEVADRNRFPLFLVVGGSVMETECLPALEEKAASSRYVLGVGTLDEFAAKLSSSTEDFQTSNTPIIRCLREPASSTEPVPVAKTVATLLGARLDLDLEKHLRCKVTINRPAGHDDLREHTRWEFCDGSAIVWDSERWYYGFTRQQIDSGEAPMFLPDRYPDDFDPQYAGVD